MGRHSDTVSLIQLENLLKVHPIAHVLSFMMLTYLKDNLCRQHPVPSHHQHDQNLHPALLPPAFRRSRD